MNINKIVDDMLLIKKNIKPVTNTMVTAFQNYINKEKEIDAGFTMIKPQKYNYFSLNASIAGVGFAGIPFATPNVQTVFKYDNPFRDIYWDEIWIKIIPDRGAGDPVVYPPRCDLIGWRLLINNIISIPDISTPPFPIVATDVNNAWVHPTWDWIQVLHPKHPIKITNGDVGTQHVACADPPNMYIFNWYLKGHSELLGA